ncbi:DUF2332 domain-containing protein [Altererythrobacter aquiaggeris]|uniref:DUF2332 domain-containing protein n=1 Tax=Aestuarierythrobacter aquiaggeris TaxID=1898396 RepID=UPI0030189A6F
MAQDLMQVNDVAAGIIWQAEHAAKAGAQGTARIVLAQLPLIRGSTATGARMRDWPGNVVEDALPLRLTGGLHNLLLTETDDALQPVYSGQITDQAEIDRIVADMVQRHDARLMPWLDGPPQTNEAGRSASIMAGLMWLSGKVGPRFEMNELGSSAGVNTMMERFAFDLGGVKAGVCGSAMNITPDWRGAPPPDNPVDIVSIQGCDLMPIDLSQPEMGLRLKSYVWPEVTGRIARIDAAIGLASEKRPDVVKMDAGEWTAQRLAAPQTRGVSRVLFHSIVWQYIPANIRAGIETAMAQAGSRATMASPLAWVALETNRETFRHELTVRYWPGGEQPALLGCAHPHGAWVEWFGD